MRRLLLVCLVALGGCTSSPDLRVSGVKVSHVIDKMECEIYQAARRNKELAKFFQPDKKTWKVNAIITLDVTQNGTIAPTFAYTNPLATATALTPLQSFSFNAGFGVTSEGHRIYSEVIEFSIADIRPQVCDARNKDTIDLAGNLGIESTMRIAAGSIDDDDAATLGTNLKDKSSFGHTSEFTLAVSLGATGPVWTLAHFKGPGQGSNGLFGGSRKDVHRVEIAFARSAPGLSTDQSLGLQINNLQSQGVRSAIQGLRTQ